MKDFLPLVMLLTICDARLQDMSGKAFTFPQETNRAHVQLNTAKEEFSAMTVCLRSITDLRRDHGLFSLATPFSSNDFLIFWSATANEMKVFIRGNEVALGSFSYKKSMWHSICCTWDSGSELVQLWVDGEPSIRKYVSSGSNIRGRTMIIIGQEQDSHGGGFDLKQSFIGMISDVHIWDHQLDTCDIANYMDSVNFSPGNVINWSALDYQITDRVLVEDKQMGCNIEPALR